MEKSLEITPNYTRFSHQNLDLFPIFNWSLQNQVTKSGQQQGIGATEEITQANSQKSQGTWKLPIWINPKKREVDEWWVRLWPTYNWGILGV